MDAIAVVMAAGAGVWFLKEACSPGVRYPVNPTDSAVEQLSLETPEQFLRHQSSIYGFPMLPNGSPLFRVPWDVNNAPDVLTKVKDYPMDSTPDSVRDLAINSLEHARKDWLNAAAQGLQIPATTSQSPMWIAFTPEVHASNEPWRVTQHQSWGFLPNDATDTDYANAGRMAKAVPPNPLLYTPDAYFVAAPGLPFRYSTP